MWLIGAMVCLLAAPWVQLSVSAGNGWPHNALRHHWLMPISCHFRDCKTLLVTSLTHVSGAIASVQTFTFIFLPLQAVDQLLVRCIDCRLRLCLFFLLLLFQDQVSANIAFSLHALFVGMFLLRCIQLVTNSDYCELCGK